MNFPMLMLSYLSYLLVNVAYNEAIKIDTNKRTVVITGANSGVGFEATKQLAATNNWNVVMACRSMDKANAAKNSITIGNNNVQVLPLDLADLKSVSQFASLIQDTQIDALVCNAGIQESTTGSLITYNI